MASATRSRGQHLPRGHHPYQEGGILPLLAPFLAQQMGLGKQKGGFFGPIIKPIGDLIKKELKRKTAQRGAGRQKKKKKKRSKYITGSSVLHPQTTLNRLFKQSRPTPHRGVTRHDFWTSSRHGTTSSPPPSEPATLFPGSCHKKAYKGDG